MYQGRADDAAIALASVYAADPAQLGRVIRGGFGTVERIVEAKDATKEVLAVRIDPACVDPADVETLQDLVLAACREASRRVDEAVEKKTAALLGGMLPR